jgi:hypothetical protein
MSPRVAMNDGDPAHVSLTMAMTMLPLLLVPLVVLRLARRDLELRWTKC